MSVDIEQLFSPERLQKIRQPLSEVNNAATPSPASVAIHQCYQNLLKQLHARFNDTSLLLQNLAELENALMLAFPLDGSAPGSKVPLKEDIVGQLEQLEELIWSYELGWPENEK